MATPTGGKTLANEVLEKSPKNFRWSQPFEDCLLELLLREQRKGNRPDSTFTATAFRNVVQDFNSMNGTTIMKKHVLSRIKTMKTHFVMFQSAFKGLSGFSWNSESKMFEAEECVWEQRIQENPNLKKFRDKACHNWDKLLELYGDSRARGDESSGLKEKTKKFKRTLEFDGLCLDSEELSSQQNVHFNSSAYGNEAFSMDDVPYNATPEEGSSLKSGGTSKSKHKRKLSLVAVMEEGYKSVADSINGLSMALVETGAKVAGAKYNVIQNTAILAALSELGMGGPYRARCYMYLSANPSKAAAVVAAPKELRSELLSDIMSAE